MDFTLGQEKILDCSMTLQSMADRTAKQTVDRCMTYFKSLNTQKITNKHHFLTPLGLHSLKAAAVLAEAA